MAVAGRVAIVPKGEWSEKTAYKRLDAVIYNNTLYFARKDVPVGTETSNTEYWSKSIEGDTVKVATQDRVGIVKSDGKTVTVDDDGTLHGSSQVDIATKENAGIVKPDSGLTIGKDGALSVSIDDTTLTMDQVNNVIKLADTLKDKLARSLTAANVVNNNTTTEPGSALDARQANPNIEGTMAANIQQINSNLKIPILTCDSNTTAVDVQDFVLSNLKSDQLSVMRVFNNNASDQVKNMGFGEFGNFFIIAMSRDLYYVLIIVNHWDGKVWIINGDSYTWNWHSIY